MFRKTAVVVASSAVLTLSACATMGTANVSPELLETRTAFALGLEKGDFTISNRVDDGVRTDYEVRTKRGKQYRCYLTSTSGGWLPFTGAVSGGTSDALCTPKGSAAPNPLSR